jgi:hypothetical protein
VGYNKKCKRVGRGSLDDLLGSIAVRFLPCQRGRRWWKGGALGTSRGVVVLSMQISKLL